MIIKLYESFIDDKRIEREEFNKKYPRKPASKEFDDEYTGIAEQLFYELDDKFRVDDVTFFPIKIILNECDNHYSISICLALGWVTRLGDNEQDWLDDRIEKILDTFKYNNNLSINYMGDSSSGSAYREIFRMINDDFPKSSMDYMSHPRGKYVDPDDIEEPELEP
jgi:hypothetical protein